MHFRGFSCPKKRLLPGLCPDDRPLPKKFIFVLEIKGEVDYYYFSAFLIYLRYLASRSVL